MEGFLLCFSKFLTEFLKVMLIMLLIQKSPHLIMIFVSAKLRLNSEKKNLLLRKIIITETMMIILVMMIILITIKILLLLLL